MDAFFVRRIRPITVSLIGLVAMIGLLFPQAASAATNATPQETSYQLINHAGRHHFHAKPAPRKTYFKRAPKRAFVKPAPKKVIVKPAPKKVVVKPAPKKAVHCKFVHIVKKSESLSKIAARYGTTVHTLTKANNIHNPNLIFVGQRICI